MTMDGAPTQLLQPDEEGLATAAEALKHGALVAFPTDTVYGLGAHLFLPEAVARIYAAKGREEEKPIAVLLADADELDQVAAEVPPAASRLAARFWPGALTIVVRGKPAVPAIVRAGGDTVGVRVPDLNLFRALARRVGAPLATTSANRSHLANATTHEEVLAQLNGRIDYIIIGRCPGGVASTVIDLSVDPPVILREGAIPQADIMATI